MDWIEGIAYINLLHTQGNSNNQQCMQLIFTTHNIAFHTQREITRVYNSSQKSHIFSY
jgi:hypothetical protein